MRRHAMQFVLAGLILWAGLSGCATPVVKEKPVPDPLLTSKKPVEGRASLTDDRPAEREDLLMPAPPPPPDMDFVVPRANDTVVRVLGVARCNRDEKAAWNEGLQPVHDVPGAQITKAEDIFQDAHKSTRREP